MGGVKCVLLDIEGTVCGISFVKDVLFPYALKALPDVLASKWEDDEFKLYRDAFPEDFRDSPEALQAHVEDLTQRDVKIAYLKNLQGYLWKTGYETRAYSTPLFPDVAPKLKQWKEEGIDLAIYSSGSVFAQRLLFGHVQASGPVTGQKRGRNEPEDGHHDSTVEPPAKRTATSDDTVAEAAAGLKPTVTEDDKEGAAKTIGSEDTDSKDTPTEDLQHLVDGWFDTTNAGSKVEASSYKTIAGKFNKVDAGDVLFLSDNVKEVDAAIAAGMRSIVVDRPGNAPLADADRQRLKVVESFNDLELSTSTDKSAGPN